MSSKKIDLTGQTFGRLIVIKEAGRRSCGAYLWECLCSCGNISTIIGGNLRSGRTNSCGCLQKELVTTHGLYKNPLYKVWCCMINRCYRVEDVAYKHYGGRGITVCDRWKDSLPYFIEDVFAGYEKGLQFDRIDNDGNYEPDNVRWVTSQQNHMNKRGDLNSSSKYKGVSWCSKGNVWVAKIKKAGVSKHLGSFKNEDDAGKAYNVAAMELFGEYANLNKIDTLL